MVLFGQKWLYSCKRDCIKTKLVVFRQIVCFREKLLYSGRVLVTGQKWLCSGKNGCIRATWL